ncbi:MAG TPA: twin-arginine translocase subunit TatC [Novosphingobium sp.]|nr:twin-arginine translocase subunit TatC [Novosphingobium sp.]HQA18485.1 twin-arginine translocase subunit TatC [Novosphingobium sp.]
MAFQIDDIDETQAPLLDHLVELRTRLIRAIGALVVAFAICLYFARPILAFLVQPLVEAGQNRLVFTKLYGQFFVELKVALFAGFFVSFPVIANQIWAFVAPGLYAKEKKAFLPFLLATPALFIAGGAMAYYLVMPVAFRWFLGFQGSQGGLSIEALPSSDDYLGLVMQFILAFGFCFLLPVLLLLLNRAGIVSRQQLAGARRYVIVGIAVIAAVITPPDVVSQLMLLVPMILLFEGSLLIMRLSESKDAQAEAAEPVPSASEERPFQ